MTQIFENQFIFNSFHAVNADTKQVYQADDSGFITVAPGDKIVFESPYQAGEYVTGNTLIFTAGDDLMIQIGDNELYPLFVPSGEKKGVQYMPIPYIKVISGTSMYFEGMAA